MRRARPPRPQGSTIHPIRRLTAPAAVVAAALAFPSGAAAVLPETLALDLHSTAGGRFIGPVASTTALAAGAPVVVEAQGTMSLWKASQWTGARWAICGTPDVGPIIGSPGVPDGPAGIDPEGRFGLLVERPTACPVTPLALPNFQLSTGAEFAHPAPLPTSDPVNHRYLYPLLGAGAPASARFLDPAAADNYGQFRLLVRDATAEDCVGTGPAAFGFADAAACAAALTPAAPVAGSADSTAPTTTAPTQPLAAPAPAPLPVPVAFAPSLSGTADSVAAQACTSRRSFTIRIRERKGRPIASARVSVAGKRAGVARRAADKRLVAQVNLKAKPKGAFAVRIDATFRDGGKAAYTRTYATCKKKQKPTNGLGSKKAL